MPNTSWLLPSSQAWPVVPCYIVPHTQVWDVANLCCLATFKMGEGVEDQQVGCLWSGPHLVSVSLSGFLNFLDLDNPSKVLVLVLLLVLVLMLTAVPCR